MTRGIQFSLRNMMWAIVWLSIFGAAYSMLRTIEDDTRGWHQGTAVAATALLLLLTFATPFLAAVALLGPARAGRIPVYVWFFLSAALTFALFPPQ